MINRVIKRDGVKEDFTFMKIRRAVEQAFKSCDKTPSEELLIKLQSNIEATFKDNDEVGIELIQDAVISFLEKERGCKKVASHYKEYRETRDRARNKSNKILQGMKEKLDAKNIENQNANVDEMSFGGRMGEANRVALKQLALDEYMSPMARKNHLENRDYIHDLDSYAAGEHNCLSIPYDDILAKGFNTRQTDVRPAKSVGTAFQLVAVVAQLQSLQQFGGVSATHLDWTMVPYVKKSFRKHIRAWWQDVIGWTEDEAEQMVKQCEEKYGELNYSNEKFKEDYEAVYKFAFNQTEREIYQAVEGMYHNLNTLQSRSGNQLPFTSINYGTCTIPEGRSVTRAILELSIKGLGSLHKTSIFPCGIFQYMKGVNDKPGTPNYDLKLLALKSTSQRLYPNYANVDWSGNAGYDVNDPRTYFSTMGALAGHEHLYIKLEGEVFDISIKDFFEYCQTGILKNARPCSPFFSKERVSIEGNKHIQNKSGVSVGSGVYSVTYLPEDVTYIGSSSNVNRRLTEHRCSIRLTGGLDAGCCFGDTNIDNYKFEVIEYCANFKEKERELIETIPNINFKGLTQRYYKSAHGNSFITERPNFTQDPHCPQELINIEDRDIKVLDRDGKWTRIKHIFRNDKRNSPFMMHIYYKEFDNELCLSCTEDHPLWTGSEFTRADKLKVGDYLYRADGEQLEITNISWHWEPVDSYDIGTVTGSFIGSDIVMHNCRTANGWDVNGFGQLKDGRGNICPCTVILPTLAMEAKEKCKAETDGNYTEEMLLRYFLEYLNKNIEEVKDMLIERFDWICSQPAESAKFMYENGTMAGYVPEEGIRSALKHGTLAVGQLGLAETLQILIGCDHTTEHGMEVAKRIEQVFKDRCAEFKQKYKLNFGVYYTPAETLCYTAMTKFRKKYGIIPKVSDHEYFTNSIHVPVWHEIDPFEKIDIESQLTGYSSAGCITYVELPSTTKNNIEALETIVDYAMDHDIPYFAVNEPNDTCLDCGYTDEIGDECPVCGGKKIRRLRRVTGYLTGDYKTAFNYGKQCETEERVKHIKN